MIPLIAPQEHWIDADDGTRLFCRDWLLPGATAAVQMVHGLGEHGGRYFSLARLFNGAGLSVRICDQRGHGNSGGVQGSLHRVRGPVRHRLQRVRRGVEDRPRAVPQ